MNSKNIVEQSVELSSKPEVQLALKTLFAYSQFVSFEGQLAAAWLYDVINPETINWLGFSLGDMYRSLAIPFAIFTMAWSGLALTQAYLMSKKAISFPQANAPIDNG